ncbi:hypothetical protein H4R33_004158 [Dimargaris cristalligena]|uniref:Uncharacterized protein n=1 Tax=Dimargaris cristalligena TaxID=215637 RepID=A0A4P9ZWX5_9FUNG|nr:hypothetical protein H4R33_004158 [Dimargaris cristalligena]RKP38164.1 hypothetical protein BJ085DRAFT_36149 [Dimargaris cristalligena]|eukprot:RKP38164.1 hypothetical protein BJ085DRAFT_36149 [Dimargaris cristalligena]
MATEEPKSLLFDLTPIDALDVVETELQRCSHELEEMLTGKTEIEIHQELQDVASQSMKKHSDIVNGLFYGILIDPSQAETNYRYLNAVVRDGYAIVLNQFRHFATCIKFAGLRGGVIEQMFWLLHRITQLNVPGIDSLYMALMRQMRGGDISSFNLKLIDTTLGCLERNISWLFNQPFVISSAAYHFTRLILDHQKYGALREREVKFTVMLLRDKFLECCHMGRELVRMLQGVAQIPDFKQLWITLMCHPEQLNPHFKGLHQLLTVPTPKMYLQSRLTFDMETKLLFIMERSHVVAANVKLALFYDWLFYDPSTDSIMSIEPAILLMERSIEKYSFLTIISLDGLIKAPNIDPAIAKLMRELFELSDTEMRLARLPASFLTSDSTQNNGLNDMPGPFGVATSFDGHSNPSPVESQFNISMTTGTNPGDSKPDGGPSSVPTYRDSNDYPLLSSSPTSAGSPPEYLQSITASSMSHSMDLGEGHDSVGANDETAELESAARDPALWIFGTSLTDLEQAIAESNSEQAVTLLRTIVQTFRETAIPPNILGAALVLILRKIPSPGVLEDLYPLSDDLQAFLPSAQTDRLRSLGAVGDGNTKNSGGLGQHQEGLPAIFSPRDSEVELDVLDEFCVLIAGEVIPLMQGVVAHHKATELQRLFQLVTIMGGLVEGLLPRWLLYWLRRGGEELVASRSSPNTGRRMRDPIREFRGHLEPLLAYLSTANPNESASTALAACLRALQDHSHVLFYWLVPLLFNVFAEECVGHSETLHILVAVIDQIQILSLNRQILLGGVRLFGDLQSSDALEAAGRSNIIKTITTTILTRIDPDYHPEAINGLLNLLRSVPPNPELILALETTDSPPLLDFATNAIIQWLRVWPEQLLQAWNQILNNTGRLSAQTTSFVKELFQSWKATNVVHRLPDDLSQTIDELAVALANLPLHSDPILEENKDLFGDDESLSDLSSIDMAISEEAPNASDPLGIFNSAGATRPGDPLVGPIPKKRKAILSDSDSE